MTALRPVPDLAAFLRGRWSVARDLRAADGTPLGRFTGVVTVTDEATLLRYHERGTLVRGEERFAAERTTLYDVIAHPAQVRFGDGRPFHDLDLSTGAWDVVHPCGPDRYTGRFTVLDAHRWVQVWEVAGPTKGYTSTTWLTRDPGRDRRATHGG